jgi:phospholipid/cholesterol/gamma-HCH transport system permease protein
VIEARDRAIEIAEDLLPAPALSGPALVGREVIGFLADVGRVSALLGKILAGLPSSGRYAGEIVKQMALVGVGSLPLVVLVAAFTGAVTAVQAAYQLEGMVPLRYVGSVVQKSVLIELGPVLTALVVGGRVGAAIAAELGTMRVTEQIDALETMAIPPIRYLILPRFLATLIMLPVVTVFADFVAVLGGFVVAYMGFDQPWHTYLEAVRNTFEPRDLFSGLTKAAVFGGTIGLMGSFYGFRAEGGAEGVGKATTQAVVASCVLVLVLDYVLANLLFRVAF